MVPYITALPYTLLPQIGLTYSQPSFIQAKWKHIRRSLNELSDELLEEVFKGLNAYDLSLISRVCKNWNYLANQDCLWKIRGFTLTQESYASYIKKRYCPIRNPLETPSHINDIKWLTTLCVNKIKEFILNKTVPNEKFLIEFYISKSPNKYRINEQENHQREDENSEPLPRITPPGIDFEPSGPLDVFYTSPKTQNNGHQQMECILKIEGLYRNDEGYENEQRYFNQFEPTIIERYFLIDKCNYDESSPIPISDEFKNTYTNFVSEGRFRLGFALINSKIDIPNAFFTKQISKIFNKIPDVILADEIFYIKKNPQFLRKRAIFTGIFLCSALSAVFMNVLIFKNGKVKGKSWWPI